MKNSDQNPQEYWLVGETFVYPKLNKSKLNCLLIQNPNFIIVKRINHGK